MEQIKGFLDYSTDKTIEDTEKAVLGQIISIKTAYPSIDGLLFADYFSIADHRFIFDCIQKLVNTSGCIDLLTLANKLHKSNRDDLIPYISEITINIGSDMHIVEHARIIKESFTSRQLRNMYQQAIGKLQQGELTDDVIGFAEKEASKIQEVLTGHESGYSIGQRAKSALNDLYEDIENVRNGKTNGIDTGLNYLNKVVGGWENSNLVVVAARPGMGKTAFALHFLLSAARSGHAVAIFSLEMSSKELVHRILISESGVDVDKYKSRNLTTYECEIIEKAENGIHHLPIVINDCGGMTINKIRAEARMLKKRGCCDMVIIDYLQLLGSDYGYSQNREREVAEITRDAKKMAKELNIPVILLSQLNRNVESRTSKRPLLSDLRESGAIEQDADIVCLIHRPDYYEETFEYKGVPYDNGIEFIIAKNRAGQTGTITMKHNGTLHRIMDIDAPDNKSF